MRAKILIVDDDRDILLGLENRIAWMGHEPVTADNGKDGLRLIEQGDFDLVLLDLELPGLSGLEVLERVRGASHSDRQTNRDISPSFGTPLIIILTAFGTIERAVQAMQLGAFNFLTKPFSADHLTVVLNKALSTIALHRQVNVLRQEIDDRHDHLIGVNAEMAAQLTIAKQAAPSNVTVLLLGETGTGKEVVARAIHRWSPRHSKPFVAVNCAALPEQLLENELFGHEKGSFTGAVKREPGKIEMAEDGTMLLDEIGDMPLPLQSRLLRVLQDQTFYRVGGTQPIHTNVRFIAATNKNLRRAIQQGTFREDLYYRLAVISLTLPPLRERIDDIPALAQHLIDRAVGIVIQRPCTLSDPALQALQQYRWPGNIRELDNVLTRALILCAGDSIEPAHLYLADSPFPSSTETETASEPRLYHESMEAHSRKVIEEALRRNGWNQTRASEELGLQRTYLTKLLRQKDISGKQPSSTGSEEDAP
ncbi:MAG: sigma-54-dependent Fis family transcriptional regulator [Nitrospiraceae bacterium]|nr:sigma-54-dependent Fis family transcriptional regulator [Nitrospiraceae bacterium]